MDKHINEVIEAKARVEEYLPHRTQLKLVCSTRFAAALRRWAEESHTFVKEANGDPETILGLYIDARHPHLLPNWAPAVCSLNEVMRKDVTDLVTDRLAECAENIKKLSHLAASAQLVTAGMIIEGTRDVGDTQSLDTLENAGMSDDRFVGEAVAYAPIIETYRQALERVKPQDWPGVWQYDVSVAFGAWFMYSFAELQQVPDHATCLDKIAELGRAFYEREGAS